MLAVVTVVMIVVAVAAVVLVVVVVVLTCMRFYDARTCGNDESPFSL